MPQAGSPLFVGVIGGSAEWIFRKREMLSVTVSAADRFVDRPAQELRQLLWSDVAEAYRLPSYPVPPARIVKERRATFLASPEQLWRRPRSQTRWENLLLAGDYVETGLPATIEGAIRSGFAAARQVLTRRHDEASERRAADVSVPESSCRESKFNSMCFHE
jgi:hydroxysqualene dehydroxylase